MATQVVMPKLSPTMEEGQLSRWLKNEGDKVSVGEGLAEIDTDKATMEAQALTSGVLRKILVPAGETVPLGAIIAIIGEPDEDISGLVSQASSAGAAPAEKKEPVEEKVEAHPTRVMRAAHLPHQQDAAPASGKAQPAQQTQAAGDGAGGNGQRGQGGRLIVSPIAARMAADAGINLNTLTGSGPGGRIVKRDIEEAMKGGAAQAQPQAEPEQPATQTPRRSPHPRSSLRFNLKEAPRLTTKRTFRRCARPSRAASSPRSAPSRTSSSRPRSRWTGRPRCASS